MLLKSLEIQGFKSFPDKTRIDFGKGLTSVVGPNGSGKSNISDAVRWVLGEQSTKTLRGEKMEDVIFSGTKTRKSQGFAEVSLTVDNTSRELAVESDEVTITRRYDRMGESEYLLNRTPVRLRDVHELLMDTGLGRDGYSLIGQGKIAEIIQSRSGDRREIFEEAAGITKYRYRKNEAERSLVRAEENLLRLRDILGELEDRVEPLREQAEKARQFLALSEQKKALEVSLWVDQIEKSNRALKDQSDRLLIGQEKHAAAEESLGRVEAEIQSVFAQMQKALVDMEEIRRHKTETEAQIAGSDSRIAVCENDILHNRQDQERISGELLRYAQRTDAAEAEIADKEALAEQIGQRIAELQQEIAQKQEQLTSQLYQSQDHTRREQELAGQVNALFLEKSRFEMTVAAARTASGELNEAIAAGDQAISVKKAELAAYQKEREETALLLEELEKRRLRLENACQGHRLKLENRTRALSALKKDQEDLALRIRELRQRAELLQGMEQSLDGYAYSVREIMKRAKNQVLTGILGTVSQKIEVNERYAAAVETALGSAMQNLIVENEASAKAAIRALQQENLGRATFLPLTSVQGNRLAIPGLNACPGFVGLACDLVEAEPAYTPVIQFLLGRIAVAEDLDTAVAIARQFNYKFRLVTLDGQAINVGGSMTGGSRNKSQSFLSRRNEMRALQQQEEACRTQLEALQQKISTLSQEAGRIQAELTAAGGELSALNEDKIRMEGEQKRLSQLADQAKTLCAGMEKEQENRRQKRKTAGETLAGEESGLRTLDQQIEEISRQLREARFANQSGIEERSRLSEELSALRITQVGLERDQDAAHRSAQELAQQRLSGEERAGQLRIELEQLVRKKEAIDGQIAAIRSQTEADRKSLVRMEESVEALRQSRQQLEGETTRLRQREREIQQEKEAIAAELVRFEERKMQVQREYDGLIGKLWEEYELTRNEAQRLAGQIEDPASASRELNLVRSRIRALGSVNVDAIEEYRELKERYDFLSRQTRDAENARAELLRLIEELTGRMRQIFEENFTQINRQFQQVFQELFGGGQAELRLTDPSDLLSSGIEILVEPPGKIINHLAALSGGEQAFVAIAIYFAILKVHPAPFCILDEIEAALDDVNVDKYAAYLRSLSRRTQFISITHRRGTMEAADVLYGVTMQEEGVSKLLQLKVSELENTSH